MRVERYADPAELAFGAAELVLARARQAIGQRGRFSLALSGGSTPRRLYQTLAADPFVSRMPWDQVHLFWGDERRVPPDHTQSNFAMVKETLLDAAPVPPANIHRLPGEVTPAAQGVLRAEVDLRGFFDPPAGGVPVFDLVLLGLGSDGHTASLFPGSPALAETERWVAAVPATAAAEPRVGRLTLTLSVINAARSAVFLVSGAAKRQVLAKILADPLATRRRYPAARVNPAGELRWLVDKEALPD